MPQAIVKRADGSSVDHETYSNLIDQLPKIIATALDTPPDGALTEKEVSVWADAVTPFPPHDISRHDISILIFAHNYPGRMANLDDRRKQITEECAMLLPKGTTLSVWVLCMPSSWGEITVA
jgi:hypothetical protein